MANSMGIDSIVLVRENSIAVRAERAFTSAATSTMPNARFWFGQITNQTLNHMIAPTALFWFRWAAMATLVTGLILAFMNGYLVDALTLGLTSGVAKSTAIGIGMWLAMIMWFNVWFVIWPNQQRALGMVQVTPDVKARSARTAMLFSRTNTLLSLPMLLCMVGQMHLA